MPFLQLARDGRTSLLPVSQGRFMKKPWEIQIWKLPIHDQSDQSTPSDQDSHWLMASLPVREQIPLAPDGVEDMPRSFPVILAPPSNPMPVRRA